MALRFQKRIKIMPGVRVNLSKSGISTSLGGPGATVNVNKDGMQGTAGVPGTGLSYKTSRPAAKAAPPTRGGSSSMGAILAVGGTVIALIALLIWAF